MKTASRVFLILSMVFAFIAGISYSATYEAFVEILEQNGLQISISKPLFLASIWISVVIVFAMGIVSLVFLGKKEPNKTAILVLGVLDIFFCSLLSGVFMIVYSTQLQSPNKWGDASKTMPSEQSFVAPKPMDPSPDGGAPIEEKPVSFQVGEKVLLLDDSTGVIVALEGDVATVRPEREGAPYIKISLSALRKS